MKHLLRKRLAVALVCLLTTGLCLETRAQVQTARPNTFITNNCNGFYEYLPQGYETGNQTYPLMIFFHGMDERGDGSPTALTKVLRNGPPRMAQSSVNTFPSSVTSGGQTYRFILISPQMKEWASRDDINAIIDYAIQHYRVNASRIYLTGLSMGGGSTLEFAGKSVTGVRRVAALVTAAGAYGINLPEANNVGAANLPFWATHNSGDGTVLAQVTIDNINTIDNLTVKPPNPLAKMTIFTAGGHDAWTRTYDPSFRENGVNVYEWMLQFTRGADVPLPVLLGEYKAALTGESTVTISWNTLAEINNRHFVLERSPDGANFTAIDTIAATNQAAGSFYSAVDNNPERGNNFYRLSQVDNDGKTTYFKVLNVVVPTVVKNYFRVSPNPAQSTVQLNWMHPETGTLQVILSDMQGRVLRQWKFDKQSSIWQQSLDVSSLAPGNYTIQLLGNTVTQVQRLIKQ
jgi:hypothetical protein